MSGQLCLRWNNHAISFNKLLNKVYLEDLYSDGTIMCQGKFYPVHQFVLSTCSEYFEELFRECVRLNNRNPFIIVKDIQPEQMEALLNYMYKGEVNVPQNMLPELIKAAEAFKIRGLAVPDDEPSHKSRKRPSVSSPPPVPNKSRRYEASNSYVTNACSDVKYVENLKESERSSCTSIAEKNPIDQSEQTISSACAKVKKEPDDDQDPISFIGIPDDTDLSLKIEEQDYEIFPEDKMTRPSESFDHGNTDNNVEDFDASNEPFDENQVPASDWDMGTTPEGEDNLDAGTEDDPVHRWMEQYPTTATAKAPYWEGKYSSESKSHNCTFPKCSYKSKRPDVLKRHIRIHTGEKPFKCLLCPYEASRQDHYDKHVKSIHLKDKRYQCALCPHKTTRKDSLRSHIIFKHRR